MKKRSNRAKRHRKKTKGLVCIFIAILLITVSFLFYKINMPINADKISVPSWISVQIIDQDGYSRTGNATKKIKGIVVHYVANPGSTAQENHDYFNSSQSDVSAHFVVGLTGEIIQCIPLSEQSSASNNRNPDTISIEVCHPDETGEFSIPTYNATVKLCVWLCKEFKLDEEDIIRHYDVTGKLCPKYYVENPQEWITFKNYVKERL